MSYTLGDLLTDATVSSSIGLISLDYYKNTYYGEDPDNDTELTKLIIRASDDVTAFCLWNNLDGLEDFNDVVKNCVFKATAAQTEWYVLNGETYNNDDSTSVSISKYSYGGNTKANANGVQLCQRALLYLEQLGLDYRGVSCRRINQYLANY